MIFLSLLLAAQSHGQSGAVERLAEAVRIKTISYQDRSQINYAEFERFHEFLRANYPRVFSQMTVETIADYSLLLRWQGSDAQLNPVLLTAHIDVVPIEPGTEADWQHPPFDGVIRDGRIFGRGTLDDKQGLLGWLEAAEGLLSEGFTPRRSVVLAFGHDEEISGRQGAAMLAQRIRELDLHFDWMIDEGGMLINGNPMLPDRPLAMVNIAEKGYLTLTLSVTGDGGHSSNPPKISTIGRLSNALARIEGEPFAPRLEAPVVAMLEAIAPHIGQPERFVFNNLWLTGSLVAGRMADDRLTQPFVRTTTALTMFNAGVKENVVPQRASAKVNFRLLPGDTPEQIVAAIEALVDDPQVEISYEQWDNIPGVASIDGPGFTVIQQAIAQVYPEAVVAPSLLTATTDTRHYIDLADNQYRFHGVMMEASQAKSIHGTDEFIDQQSYLKSIEVARHIIQLGTR